MIAVGQSFNFNFDDGTGTCCFDVRAKFQNGVQRTNMGVNVCDVSRWTVGCPALARQSFLTECRVLRPAPSITCLVSSSGQYRGVASGVATAPYAVAEEDVSLAALVEQTGLACNASGYFPEEPRGRI
jgi:hypothetical protein